MAYLESVHALLELLIRTLKNLRVVLAFFAYCFNIFTFFYPNLIRCFGVRSSESKVYYHRSVCVQEIHNMVDFGWTEIIRLHNTPVSMYYFRPMLDHNERILGHNSIKVISEGIPQASIPPSSGNSRQITYFLNVSQAFDDFLRDFPFYRNRPVYVKDCEFFIHIQVILAIVPRILLSWMALRNRHVPS